MTFATDEPNPRDPRLRIVSMSSTQHTKSRNVASGFALASVLTLALVAGCGTSGSQGTGNASLNKANTVHTTLLSFMPATLTVKVGTTVTWTDTDSIAHTVTTGTFVLGSDGLRTSEHPDGRINMPLSQGHDITYTFTKPGKYTYYCSIHKGMDGTVIVTP